MSSGSREGHGFGEDRPSRVPIPDIHDSSSIRLDHTQFCAEKGARASVFTVPQTGTTGGLSLSYRNASN